MRRPVSVDLMKDSLGHAQDEGSLWAETREDSRWLFIGVYR
jgi:hypothetical protein